MQFERKEISDGSGNKAAVTEFVYDDRSAPAMSLQNCTGTV